MLRNTLLLLSSIPLIFSASLQQITENFGPNPRNVGFYIYVPDKLAARPPVLAFPHWCHGSAQAAHQGSQYATLADKYGFIVIYSDSPNTADKCWDLSSKDTLTHDAGGDSLGIASMIRYTLKRWNGDPGRVFVSGISSGGMMTNVLLGSYPELFAAGAAFAGVPFACYAGDGYGVWSDACAKGNIRKTGAEWAALVKAAYPGYSGFRPKLQLYHGTADEIVNYQNHLEGIKEWTAVYGISETPAQTIPNTPLSGWTKTVYGRGELEAFSAAGVPHNIQNQEALVMAFFDLTCTTGACFSRPGGSGTPPSSTLATSTRVPTSTKPVTSSTTKAVTPSSTSVAPTPTPTGTVKKWGQCGGINYDGPTVCAEGTCHVLNPYYSQCY